MQEKDLTWMREEVGDGFQRLFALRLRDAPPADMIDVVAEIWLDSLMNLNKDWQESLDRQRIKTAFIRLTQLYREWPSPPMLIEELPARKLPKLLPEPPPTKEEAAEILRALGLNKNLIGSKIAQRKIQEEKEAKEKHQRWVEFIEQQKKKALNLYNLTKGD